MVCVLWAPIIRRDGSSKETTRFLMGKYNLRNANSRIPLKLILNKPTNFKKQLGRISVCRVEQYTCDAITSRTDIYFRRMNIVRTYENIFRKILFFKKKNRYGANLLRN